MLMAVGPTLALPATRADRGIRGNQRTPRDENRGLCSNWVSASQAPTTNFNGAELAKPMSRQALGPPLGVEISAHPGFAHEMGRAI